MMFVYVIVRGEKGLWMSATTVASDEHMQKGMGHT